MFDYALKQMKVQASTEEADVVATPEEVESRFTLSMSDGAKMFIKSGAIRGIVTAFATRMALVGLKKEEIAEKVTEFLNSCYTAKDIDGETVRWMKDTDWYARIPSAYSTVAYNQSYQNSLWGLFDDTVSDAIGTRQWACDCTKHLQKQMTENERAVLDNFENARKAYWEALDARDQYYRKAVKAIIKDIVVKYAQHLEKMDPELYKYMLDRVGDYNSSDYEDGEAEAVDN